MTEELVDQIREFFNEYVFGFIYHDIQAAIDGKANYLAALGLLAYTEFMGGLLDGTLRRPGRSKARFYAFWERMGPEYQSVRARRAQVKIYSNVRSGLVHSYFIAQNSVIKMTISDGHGECCGVEVLEPGGKVLIIVEKYFQDFKRACQEYYRELVEQRDPELLERFRGVMGRQWYFKALVARDKSK